MAAGDYIFSFLFFKYTHFLAPFGLLYEKTSDFFFLYPFP